MQHAGTIGPNHFGIGVTGFLSQWGPRVFHTGFVALRPFRLTVGQQQVGSHQRQAVQCMAQGFSHT